MVAPMLGGGHGWLQGRYGLMADNLVSARLVVANGSVLTVSATENEDLFWALRGAGHNFGIVASFEYKIYDRTPENENWSFEFLIFRKDKFDQVYEWANQVTGKEMPVESVHFSMWSKNPDIDPDNVRGVLCNAEHYHESLLTAS